MLFYDTVLSGRRVIACRKIILPPFLWWKCFFLTPFSLVEVNSLTKDHIVSMFGVEMLFSYTVYSGKCVARFHRKILPPILQ